MSHHVYCPEAATDPGEQLWAEHGHHFDDDRDYVLVTADLACANLTIADHDAYNTHRGDDLLTVGERRIHRDDALYRMGWWRLTPWIRDATTGRSTARVVAMTWRR